MTDKHTEEKPIPEEHSVDGSEENAMTEEAPAVLENLPLEDQVAQQDAALEAAKNEAAENLDGWQRARAEFANYKKRIERERENQRAALLTSLLRNYLVVVDDLERALANRPEDGDGAEWAAGVELIYQKFLTLLEAEGVTPMQAEGAEFDPSRHEAISMEDSPNHESGQIIEVIQPGYMAGESVLRPARVRVAG